MNVSHIQALTQNLFTQTDFSIRNQLIDTKMISQLLEMTTNTEAPHHLSVGSTTIGGSIYLNPYLYLVIG